MASLRKLGFTDYAPQSEETHEIIGPAGLGSADMMDRWGSSPVKVVDHHPGKCQLCHCGFVHGHKVREYVSSFNKLFIVHDDCYQHWLPVVRK